MIAIVMPIVVKSYVRMFENLSILADIDSRMDQYHMVDRELEKDFDQLVQFARKDGWKFSPELQVELAHQVKMICEYRQALTDLMVRDINRL